MLVVTRLPEESIMIGDDVEVTVIQVRGNKVRIGIKALPSTAVHRKEVWQRIQKGMPNVK